MLPLLYLNFMLLQTSAVFNCILTCDSCKGLLTSVGNLVFLETTALFKWLSTFNTCKWLLYCMGPFVILQTSAVFQCLNTCFAWKWFLSCVCPFMLLQTLAVFKFILTCDAWRTFYQWGHFRVSGKFIYYWQLTTSWQTGFMAYFQKNLANPPPANMGWGPREGVICCGYIFKSSKPLDKHVLVGVMAYFQNKMG